MHPRKELSKIPWRPLIELWSHVDNPDQLKHTNIQQPQKQRRWEDVASGLLPAVIEVLENVEATWRFNNVGYQFKLEEGCLVQWWPSTGRFMWQGPKMRQGRSKSDGAYSDDSFLRSLRDHVQWMQRREG